MSRVVRDFFTAAEGPFNLAVARICFFAVLPFLLPQPSDVKRMAALPESFEYPPQLLGRLVADLDLTPDAIGALWVMLVLGSIAAALGVFARTAAAVVAVALFLYVGETQIYGKVNHNHHLLWIALVFAVARSADALSLGVVVRGAAGRLPVVADLPESRAYALPLRAIWILLGLLYLFPGLYKLKLGPDWLDPLTQQRHMWHKWVQSDFEPLMRVDQMPVMLVAGAAAVVLFEVGFIVLILTRLTRHVAILVGLWFHTSTKLLLNISFVSLPAMYPMLVDWTWLSRKAFARRRPLVFLYDGNCGICKRTSATLQRLVVPGSVTFANALDQAELDRHAVPAARRGNLAVDLHVYDGRRFWTGYDAYRRLLRRQPWAWPVLPLLYLPPVRAIGDRVYRRVADSRSCRVGMQPRPQPEARRPALAPLIVVSLPLFGLVAAAGATGKSRAWPVAQYPTFAVVPGPAQDRLIFELAGAGGTRRVSGDELMPFLRSTRVAGLAGTVLTRMDAAQQRRALDDFRSVIPASLRERHDELRIVQESVLVDPAENARVAARKTLRRMPLG